MALLRAVGLRVSFGRLSSVMQGMSVVAVSYVRMMSRLLMVPRLMMRSCFPVMVGRMLMVFGGLRVMTCCFLRHG